MDSKTCRVCAVTKPSHDFRPLAVTCRDCNNETRRAFRQTKAGKQHCLEIERNSREKFKEEIKASQKLKATCECGSVVVKRSLAEHRRTNKHKEKMSIINKV